MQVPSAPLTILLGAATRPHPGERENGDAWTAQRRGAACRLALIDALGHGPEAAAVARIAVAQLEANPDLEPVRALEACHGALIGTRGAAISIALLEPELGRLTFAGVGNVDGRLWHGDGRSEQPIAYRGIVGTARPTLRAFELPLRPGALFVLFSDGIRSGLDLSLLSPDLLDDPARLATEVLARWARQHDDATVVVASIASGQA